jgi:hypothetical protein
LIRVDAVQVAKVQPGTEAPWDRADKHDGSECGLLGAVAGAVVTPIVGNGLEYLCQVEDRSKHTEKDPSDPDLAVRLAAGDAAYETYTALNSAGHVFGSQFVVPLGAIPPEGLTLTVIDRDADSYDLIGQVRLTRQQLSGVAASPTPVLSLTSGAIQRLDIVVATLDGRPEELSVPMNAKVGTVPARFRPVRAGEVVEIFADGHYRIGTVNDDLIDPRGLPADRLREYNFENEPFRSAPHGSALALIGRGDAKQGLVVAPCGHTIAKVSGPLAVGVNDTDPANNRGDLSFSVRVRPPTPEEWLRPWNPDRPCGSH